MTFNPRTVEQIIFSREQSEGVGAQVRRTIGTPKLKSFDPFLMLDEFKTAKPAGFPDHPHRGFTTATFILPSSRGAFVHEDFRGHKGTIQAGDLQWMCAGKGILHSEMPVDEREAHGLQLWINLSKKDKMRPPSYQELVAKDIPRVTRDGVTARVIAGEAMGIFSPIQSPTPVHYAHFVMESNATLEQNVPSGFNSFVYAISGEGWIEEAKVQAHHVVTLNRDGDGLLLSTKDSKFEFVLISGQMLNEPVVQHGPFVMNTEEEIYQAMRDFQSGTNGFENATTWRSNSE